MKNLKIKISLYLNYFVFAILLNSVGIVILQMQQNFGISKISASVLEGFKDFPIAICSFLLASFLSKIGIKRAMLIALAMVSIICLVMPFANSFWYFKLLFAVVGFSFGLIKISVFTSIGLVTTTDKEHSSMMGFLEGFFMVGVLLGNVLFSLFINDKDPLSIAWLNVYWVLGGLSIISFLFLYFSKLDESQIKNSGTSLLTDFKNSAQLFRHKKVILFLGCAFLFVLVEQSFQTWTPTFYKNIIKVPTSMSIQAGAVLAGAFAVGRFLSGYFSKKIKWIYIVVTCLVLFALSILCVLPLTEGAQLKPNANWLNAPLVVYLFPLMGIFLSPIYPSINSVILYAIPKKLQGSMSGLIVVFSAIGGTLGSMLTGFVFQKFGGQHAFYLSIIPLVLLLLVVVWMSKTQYNPTTHE